MEENIFNNSKNTFEENNNPCIGHFKAIEVGGLGHYKGDRCGCDTEVLDPEPQPQSVPIDGGVNILLIVGIVIITLKNLFK